MEKLRVADERLKSVSEKYERDFKAHTATLDQKQSSLVERLNSLHKAKIEIAELSGEMDAAGDDLVEVNAGGEIVLAKRSTLTQLEGTRLEALFSGRWDKKLQRDSSGRIFLDVNPVGFRAIVDYLNEMTISSEDNPSSPPSVTQEQEHILGQQMDLFGLCTTKMPDSYILQTIEEINRLHGWLREDGSDGEFGLLYRSSRDGESASAFHSRCDNQGCTLTIIETDEGHALGGYSNTPWATTGGYCSANKAFLFVLSGNDISSPCKMKQMNLTSSGGDAVEHRSDYCPIFGSSWNDDLYVQASRVHLKLGRTYGLSPATGDPSYKGTFNIKEMEVFQVTDAPSAALFVATRDNPKRGEVKHPKPVNMFTEDINKAINAKQESLLEAEAELLHLEESFRDERTFISAFATGNMKDVVTLNVSGTVMATKRSTLQALGDSVLARQFDDTKWTEQSRGILNAKDWTPGDVGEWAKNIDGISEDVAGIFKENEITGRELLALGARGLKEIGVKRAGSIFPLLAEIEKLQNVTLIEHSPYCFGRILDYLRQRRLHSQGLAREPAPPKVCGSQKRRFEKVARYYFPGESAKLLLG